MSEKSYRRLAASVITFAAFSFGLALMSNSWSQTGYSDPATPAAMPRNAAIAPAQVATTGTSMMASVILANGFQQIAVVEPSKSSMAVYHIDPATGEIQLKSVRKMDADFMLEEFNLSEPTPSTIRKNVR
jgi:hypothetical protein